MRIDSTNVNLNCGDMEVVKPLIVKEHSKDVQFLQVSCTVDLRKHIALLRYASVDVQGKEILLHATCTVTFEDGSDWLAGWDPSAYLIHGRFETLNDRLTKDKADRVSRRLAYKMISALVESDEIYQGMENVVLDSANFEATSRVIFQTEEKHGNFFCSPFWIDSLCHISGFVLNGSDAVDSKKFVYISHGWKSMRFARPLLRTTQYRSYVKMQPAANNIMSGDAYILEGNTIIGVVGGLKFQRIARTMLDTLLPPEQSSGSTPITGGQVSTIHDALPPSTANTPSKALDNKKTTTHRQLDILRSPPSILALEAFTLRRDIATTAIDIISQETGRPLSELHDDCLFADLGVDSLLSLQISGKFREMLNIALDLNLFVRGAIIMTVNILHSIWK